MESIKKTFSTLFHGLTNRQNIVSVKAGTIVALASHENYASLSKDELLSEVTHMIEELRLIEKAALEAGEFTHKIDDLVWPLLNTTKPRDLNESSS